MPRSRYLNYKSKDKSNDKSNVVDLQNIVIDYNTNVTGNRTGNDNSNTSDHLSDQNFILGIGSEPIDSDVSSDSGSYRENDFDEEDNNMVYSSDDDYVMNSINIQRPIKYKRLTYNDVKYQVNKYYDLDTIHKYSSALDILASYLKGQKIIYMEARSYTVGYLNLLMMPAIFITSVCSVSQAPLKQFEYGTYILSGLNAFLTFILAVVSFMKLDASAQAYKISSHQYDSLQTYVEFQSGQVLLFSNPDLYSTGDNIKSKSKSKREAKREAKRESKREAKREAKRESKNNNQFSRQYIQDCSCNTNHFGVEKPEYCINKGISSGYNDVKISDRISDIIRRTNRCTI